MCGIAGFSGRFDRGLLDRMNAVMAHRGPDDAGTWHDPKTGTGLTHRRLTIIDLSSRGRQPMWDCTETVVICFNGEIFNYRELREDLVDEGHRFRSQSDTEVLLNLYLAEGERMLSRLNGMYAFAIWDTRSDSLFLARDGVGVKPLYHAQTPRGFLFASEIKALLEEPSVERTLDLEALHHYLAYLWCPAPRTVLEPVKKLEPGHALVVKDGRIARHWQFYELPFDAAIDELSEAEAVERVRQAVHRAVERQMVADVPVGAFLSGGLDSSSVVAFARQFSPGRKLQCFTIGFKGGSFEQEGMADDLPFAREVAAHLDVDLHTVYVGAEMVDQLEHMIYHLDEPQADPAPLNALFICRLAREHGLKVLLSGAGGDDIFTGYRRHFVLQQERYWAWLPAASRRMLAAVAKRIPVSGALGRRLSKAFRYADLDGDARLASYFYWIDPWLQRSLYTPEVRERLGTRPEPLVQALSRLPAGLPRLNRMLYLEGKHFLTDHNLNYTDKMSMAVGVEVRVPLLDPDLVEVAARMPLEFKQHGRVGKWIFKKAMEPYLPRGAIYRPKTGFGAPLRHWLRHELRPVVADTLSESSLDGRGLFDPGRVRQLIEADRAGRVDGTYSIFSLICIEMWCRTFLDRRHRGGTEG